MVNYGKLIQGVLMFFMGFLAILVIQTIMPYLTSAGDAIYSAENISEIAWFGAIITYLLLGVIGPIWLTAEAIKEGESNGMGDAIAGAAIFLLSIAVTAKAWYIITALPDYSPHAFITVIYWLGLISVWVMITVITPITLIRKATAEN